jgi:hypothetical protein
VPIFDDPSYSPMWDVTPAVWTDASVKAGFVKRTLVDSNVADLVAAGRMTSFATDPALPVNTDVGLRALGVLANYPVVLRLWNPVP